VTQYGAVGDGQTDNTAAVAKATAALMESPNGGTLSFPAGTFLMLEQPENFGYIFLQSNTTGATATYNVLGSGLQTTVLTFNASNAALVLAAGATVVRCHQPARLRRHLHKLHRGRANWL
jgi:hypothetical protein